MAMLVNFPIMARMGVIVWTMITRVIMIVGYRITFVYVLVAVYVKMLVGMSVRVLMGVRFRGVRVAVRMRVGVFVAMPVFMLVVAFHAWNSFLDRSNLHCSPIFRVGLETAFVNNVVCLSHG